MIVAEYFDHDDIPLAWLQHNVYGEALGVLLQRNRELYLNACHIACVSPDLWPDDVRIDRRTMQVAHDLTAAAWRWQVSPPQTDLLLDHADSRKTMREWLDWLSAEVGSWGANPSLVQSVVAIVRHQNSAIGYAGELRLHRALLSRFDMVPWREA